MTGERDVDALLAQLNPTLDPRVFVFATIDDIRLSEVVAKAVLMCRESEGVTVILEESDALAAGLETVFPCRRITLQVHSALDAVGFLAAILPTLARHGMGVNPVSAFYHDHLFVPADRAEEAMRVLRALAAPHVP